MEIPEVLAPEVIAPEVIAHRGDPVACVENTWPAIERAVIDGANIVEVDIKETFDGQVVLLHDATCERIFGLDKPIASLRWSQVRELRAPDGSGIPLLSEVLRALAGRAQLLIDMTQADLARAAVPVVREAKTSAAWCGDHAALAAVRDELPDAEIYLTMPDERLPSQELVDRIAPAHVNPNWQVITPDYAAAVAAMGVGLSTWTVDEAEAARALVALGVRRVISNHASAIRRALAEQR